MDFLELVPEEGAVHGSRLDRTSFTLTPEWYKLTLESSSPQALKANGPTWPVGSLRERP